MEVAVSPEDDAEIRRITLINHGCAARKLKLISAAELSLAPHDADRRTRHLTSSSSRPKPGPICRRCLHGAGFVPKMIRRSG